VRFAISIPQFFSDGEFDPGAFRDYFARAEDLGYHSAWAQEAPLGRGAQLSPMEVMTYAAACTTRLRLGTTVFVSTLHLPVHFAKALATIDQLSGGRLDPAGHSARIAGLFLGDTHQSLPGDTNQSLPGDTHQSPGPPAR